MIDEEINKNVALQNYNVNEMTEIVLDNIRNTEDLSTKSISMPITELTTLGAGVSSLIPAFNTVTQTMTVNTSGLYRLANASRRDILKVAKNGNYWGAFKTYDGRSKFVQMAAADPLSVNNTMVMNVNPTTIMVAVVLFSIEKEIHNIKEMKKSILSFLEIEKESEIEADVITLTNIVTKYKHNWDNERYLTSNHKMICDIQRSVRKNMILYQKQVVEAMKSKQLIVVGNKVSSILSKLQRKFQYYRLSIYTFSLASLAEIMFSCNFKSDNIHAAMDEIRKYSNEYRALFGKCSVYLENISTDSVENNFLKSVGVASEMMGKLIGNIPKVKGMQADRFLKENGKNLKDSTKKISREIILSFAEVSNPNIGGFLQTLDDMDQIYNKTTGICFDRDNIYMLSD